MFTSWYDRMAYLYVVSFVIVFLTSEGLCTTYEEIKAATGERPTFNGVMGKFLNDPGLIFEPNLEADKGLIHFNKARWGTFTQYSDRLQSVLKEYEYGNENTMQYIQNGNMIDCASMNQYRQPEDIDKSCRFDIVNLGTDCVSQQTYGFEDGQPCIALSLERIMNWVPEPYTNETVPEKIRDSWNQYAITVHCEGEDPVSKDNLGDLTYYQPSGFDFKYFPYTGQPGWMNPIVFLRMENLMPAIVMRVTCRAYAKNMKHADMMNTGQVTFDILVD